MKIIIKIAGYQIFIRFYIILIICLVVILACAPLSTYTITKQTPSCKILCEKQRQFCYKLCNDDCYHCTQSVYQVARYNYEKYTNEQSIKSGVITRQLNSYRDPLQCHKITCDCEADYRNCQQLC